MHIKSIILPRILLVFFLTIFSSASISFSADIPGVYDSSENENEFPDFDESGFDDIENGFDEEPAEIQSNDVIESSHAFDLDGYLSFEGACSPWNDNEIWDGLTRLRSKLFLELNETFFDSWRIRISGKAFYDLAFQINHRDDYTHEVLNAYEDDVELFEAYLMGSFTRSLDVKIGRQIVVWGKSDYIRITDVLNPLDQEVPGLTDIEFMRLPVTMARADFFIGDWSLTGIGIVEHRFDKNSVYGSDFYFFSSPEPHEDIPVTSLKNTEFAMAVNGVFSGWDISFNFAKIFDDAPYFDFASVQMKHEKILMTGLSTNIALGNWLLIGEAAYFSGINYSLLSGKTFTTTKILGGLEYSGFNDMTINIEGANTHVHNYEKVLKLAPIMVRRDQFQSVFRISRNFMNDTLVLSFLALTYGTTGQGGALQRMTAEYDITDQIQITCVALLYKSGYLTSFENIGDNDRLYVEIKYNF